MHTAFALLSLIFVSGSMFGVLTWFFRRLRRIEEASWGTQGHESLRGLLRGAVGRVRQRWRERR